MRYKSKGGSKVLYSDDPALPLSEVAQRDFSSILPSPVLFQSIFDIGYFMSLSEKAQRTIVLDNSIRLNMRQIAEKEYPWLKELDTRIPVIFGDYEQERKRFLALRKSKSATLSTKIGELKANSENITESEDETKSIGERIAELRSLPNETKRCATCNQFLPNKELDTILAELRGLEYQWSDLIDKNKRKTTNLEGLKNEINNLEKVIDELTLVIDMLNPKALPALELKLKLKPIKEFLSKRIPGLEIVTEKEVKTTLEIEETFQIRVGGKPYNRLSTGEQLKVDIAISEMLDKLSNRAVNMFFIDKAESLSSKPKLPEGQTFIASVTNGTKLRVEGKSNGRNRINKVCQ
jgi:DNA repair exonuclease SbcCD ATPase subunit